MYDHFSGARNNCEKDIKVNLMWEGHSNPGLYNKIFAKTMVKQHTI
jgi:hypothetical protein